MPQFNVANEFTVFPGITTPSSPVLAANSARKFLQVANNGSSGNVRIKFDQNFLNPANEVQTIQFPGSPNAGTFTVQDWLGNVTAAQAYNVSAGNLQTALQGLAAIGSGNVTITGSVAAGFTLTYGGTLGNTLIPAPKLTVVSSLQNTSLQQNAIQNVTFGAVPTAGTFKLADWLGNQTTTLNWNDSGATIKTALNALTAINGGVSAVTYAAGVIAITFGTPLGNQAVPLITVPVNALTNNAVLTSNIQTLFAEPLPLAGTFELMFKGKTTTALKYNATAGQIQAAFQALSTVGAGNCLVSGFSFVNGFSFAFTGALANAPQPTIQVLDGPASQYGAVNGGTSGLHANINPTNDIQKHVPQEIKILVVQEIPGVGPSPVSAAVATAQLGIAPTNTATVFAVSVPGQPQVVDGVLIQAGRNQPYAYAVPLGAMYIISDTPNVPVAILEG